MSRILQGIIQGMMTGVGFIGAGVIFRGREPEGVRNLTRLPLSGSPRLWASPARWRRGRWFGSEPLCLCSSS